MRARTEAGTSLDGSRILTYLDMNGAQIIEHHALN